MILPPRPLRLRASYVARTVANALVGLAIAGLALTGAFSLGWDVRDDLATPALWSGGAPLDVVAVHVSDHSLVPFVHLYGVATTYRNAYGERVRTARVVTIGAASASALAAGDQLRRAPSGQLIDGLEAATSGHRALGAGATALALAALACVLVLDARRRARSLGLARRAAHRSEELLVDPAPGSSAGRERFFASAPRAAVTYRGPGVDRRVVEHRRRSDEPPLLKVGERAVVLRPDVASTDVVFVRVDLWPFAVSGAERSAALERLEQAAQDGGSSSRRS